MRTEGRRGTELRGDGMSKKGLPGWTSGLEAGRETHSLHNYFPSPCHVPGPTGPGPRRWRRLIRKFAFEG